VLIFDALAMTFSHVGLQRAPDRAPIAELIDYQGFCAGPKATKAAASSPLDNVNGSSTIAAGGRTMDEAESATPTTTSHFHAVEPKDCFEKLCAGWTPWVLDVRLPTEHAIVHLPFTDRVVPHRQVRVTDIPTTGDVLVYCKGGVRGAKACAALIDAGVPPERLYNLQGGIMQWQKDIDPSMPRY
jgi:sulfur-carrier protein adenylyltransferase/sulfurtransferase